MIENTSKLNKSSIKVGLLISKTRSELFGNGKNRKGIFDLYIDIINSPQLTVLRYKKTSDQISGMNDTIESGLLEIVDERAFDESLNESDELDRKGFTTIVKLGDHPYDGYSILNDGCSDSNNYYQGSE